MRKSPGPRPPEVRAKIAAGNKGKVRSAETRQKLSESRKGKKFGPRPPEVGRKISAALTGKKKSPEHCRKISLAKSKGGNGVPVGRFADPRYYPWQDAVFSRDHYTCQGCGYQSQRGLGLHAHHIQPYSSCEELRYEVSNGQTLCRRCHSLLHRKHWTPDTPNNCACGCGEQLSVYAMLRGSRYINGHSAGVVNRTPAYREKMRAAITGKKRSLETRRRLVDALKRRGCHVKPL